MSALKPQTQIILSEEDFTVYHKNIEVNFLALKEKVDDNLLVTQTLIQLIYNYLNSNFSVLKKTSPGAVEFEIRTHDTNDLILFKEMLNQCIAYTFDVFLTPELFEKFSTAKRGNRVTHENNKTIQNVFKVGFEAFCRKDTLQKKLSPKDEKEKIQKI